jgi:hypothetical protein
VVSTGGERDAYCLNVEEGVLDVNCTGIYKGFN